MRDEDLSPLILETSVRTIIKNYAKLNTNVKSMSEDAKLVTSIRNMYG